MPVVALLVAAALSACAAGPVADAPRADVGAEPRMAATTVTVDAQDYQGAVSAGPNGVVVGAELAEATSGASVRVSRPGLLNSDGIEAKKAAAVICAQAGGIYDGGPIGRFVQTAAADGSWVFDGSCN